MREDKLEGMPESGDLVICKVKKILDYGVFVDLVEYEGLQGFVHISQVATSWIKNIRNFVKENQIRVARVSGLNREKNQIDLSFTKVTPSEQKEKLEVWKQLKKPQKLLEVLAKEHKTTPEALQKEIADPLLEKHETLYDAFVDILQKGTEAAKGVPAKWHKPLQKIIEKNIQLPTKTVRGTLTLSSNEPNGVELIKKALAEAQKEIKKEDAELFYEGAGRYAVRVTTDDFKTSEELLKRIVDRAISEMESQGGQAEFERSD